jgi:hypothetical protein
MKGQKQVKGQSLKVKETARDSRNGSGSICVSGEGEHGVRPYNICVGANSMFALRSEDTFHQVHA